MAEISNSNASEQISHRIEINPAVLDAVAQELLAGTTEPPTAQEIQAQTALNQQLQAAEVAAEQAEQAEAENEKEAKEADRAKGKAGDKAKEKANREGQKSKFNPHLSDPKDELAKLEARKNTKGDAPPSTQAKPGDSAKNQKGKPTKPTGQDTKQGATAGKTASETKPAQSTPRRGQEQPATQSRPPKPAVSQQPDTKVAQRAQPKAQAKPTAPQSRGVNQTRGGKSEQAVAKTQAPDQPQAQPNASQKATVSYPQIAAQGVRILTSGATDQKGSRRAEKDGEARGQVVALGALAAGTGRRLEIDRVAGLRKRDEGMGGGREENPLDPSQLEGDSRVHVDMASIGGTQLLVKDEGGFKVLNPFQALYGDAQGLSNEELGGIRRINEAQLAIRARAIQPAVYGYQAGQMA